jgi:hypothetical protein
LWTLIDTRILTMARIIIRHSGEAPLDIVMFQTTPYSVLWVAGVVRPTLVAFGDWWPVQHALLSRLEHAALMLETFYLRQELGRDFFSQPLIIQSPDCVNFPCTLSLYLGRYPYFPPLVHLLGQLPRPLVIMLAAFRSKRLLILELYHQNPTATPSMEVFCGRLSWSLTTQRYPRLSQHNQVGRTIPSTKFNYWQVPH